ncbi:MAG: STT3 domain-containing protein [Nanoarchaeota archaeon]
MEISNQEEQINLKEEGQKIFSFFKSKKGQWILVGILLLAIIIFGSWIRLQNLPLLKDQTTGEYIPIALDPFYFLRIAETIVNNGGVLPAIDVMRNLAAPAGPVGFTIEILPQTIIYMWEIANIFGNYSIQYVDVISPVIFFIFGLIIFFFLLYSLTSSKTIALLSSFFLAITPSYLYRTMAGFSDHEAIGMFAFFLTLLWYSHCLKYLEKEDKGNLLKIIGLSAMLGFLTSLTQASWGGIVRYILLIIPLSYFLLWILKTKKFEENKNLFEHIIFYFLWIVSSIIFSSLFGFNISGSINALVSGTGIIGSFVLGFIIVDYILISNIKKFKDKRIIEYRPLISGLVIIILGGIVLIILRKDLAALIMDLLTKFYSPFGESGEGTRLGLTVAENKQPYLTEWIAQSGKAIFYLFVAGILFVGFNISKGIKRFNHKLLFNLSWTIFIIGLLFSRISPSSILNGDNFLSQFFYIGGTLFFSFVFIYIYFKEQISVKSELILIFSWSILMLISGRGAIRLFFVITPFVCFMASYALFNLYAYARNSKEELTKWGTYLVLGLLLIALVSGSISATKSSIQQGKYTGPSANLQWQKAMEWVRQNTSESAIFSHWWDYGYWVEYLGKRSVISDGGHFQGTFRDHLIGRYILINPSPESAMSFMKSNNVSYLLIDQTDIGKYPAYSSIGSNKNWDRISSITTLISDPKQIQETSKGEIRIYSGTSGVGDDIIYEENGTTIFLPGATFDKVGSPNYKSFMIGVILEMETGSENVGSFSLKQPQGVFVYEGKQVRIPLRYAYFGENKIDFGKGLDAGIKIIPRAYSSGEGLQIDQLGAALYFNQRTINSLVVQLFLLNDPDKLYPTVKLAHSEDHPIIQNLKNQGAISDEFLVYQGIQGPIKIFEIGYSEDVLINEEFTRYVGEWAEFDEVVVKK